MHNGDWHVLHVDTTRASPVLAVSIVGACAGESGWDGAIWASISFDGVLIEGVGTGVRVRDGGVVLLGGSLTKTSSRASRSSRLSAAVCIGYMLRLKTR